MDFLGNSLKIKVVLSWRYSGVETGIRKLPNFLRRQKFIWIISAACFSWNVKSNRQTPSTIIIHKKFPSWKVWHLNRNFYRSNSFDVACDEVGLRWNESSTISMPSKLNREFKEFTTPKPNQKWAAKTFRLDKSFAIRKRNHFSHHASFQANRMASMVMSWI